MSLLHIQTGGAAVQGVSRAAYRGVEKPSNGRQGRQQRMAEDVAGAMGVVMIEGGPSGSDNGDNGKVVLCRNVLFSY